MSKKGFTLIEVSLFLAITGLLFIGIAAGVQNSIFQQRINDSVQSFTEFLRSIYSEVTNVQNVAGGKSDRAIYGKLITFGEKNEDGSDKIYSYSVIGKTDTIDTASTTTASAIAILKSLNANIITVDSEGVIKPINLVQSYTPKWASSIEPACNENNNTCDYRPFKGALLIVRHPKSGIVYTYVRDEVIEVNEMIKTLNNTIGGNQAAGEGEKINLPNILFDGDEKNNYGFAMKQVDFCVNPDPGVENTIRRDVRIIKGARNASGVETVSDTDSKCWKKE